MARIDKALQIVRGKAGTAFASTGSAIGVRFNTGGSVVLGNASSCDGVLVTNKNRAAYGTALVVGDRVDVLKRGEVVEFGGTAGDRIECDASGNLVAGSLTSATYVGVVLDGGDRLLVEM